jgi:hypothetical protein
VGPITILSYLTGRPSKPGPFAHVLLAPVGVDAKVYTHGVALMGQEEAVDP